MKRCFCCLSVLLLILLAGMCACTAGAETQPVVVKNATELNRILQSTSKGKTYSILLDNDIYLTDSLNQSLRFCAKSMTFDGQGHVLRCGKNISSNAPQFTITGSIKLQHISDLGNTSFMLDKKAVLGLDDVTLTGENCLFWQGQVTLTNVRTAVENADQRRFPYITMMQNGKMILDRSCEIGEDWRLIVTSGSSAVVNCDYYDVELECWVKNPSSFTGEGTGHGTMKVWVRTNGVKATADIRSEALEVRFCDPDVKTKQTVSVSGTARQVKICSNGSQIRKNQEAKLNLTGVEELVFRLEYHDQSSQPEDSEEFRKQIRKSLSHISLKKVTGPDGKPVQAVNYEVLSWDENGSPQWIKWTDTLN